MTPKSLEPWIVEQLQRAAVHAAEKAYAPYSKFRVGAALLISADGRMITACNVENVSYGLTICAERSAIAQAVAQLGPEVRVLAAAVANRNEAASPPCGACRQVLAEFMDPDAPIYFPADSGPECQSIAELLPFGFRLELPNS